MSEEEAEVLGAVSDWLAEELGLAVGPEPDHNPFALGLHSLSLVRFTLEAERRWGVEIGPEEVFLNPTPRRIAALISERLKPV